MSGTRAGVSSPAGRRLGADALADANNAWWNVSAWQDRGPMLAFVNSEPHLDISKRLDHFCDEATLVDWEQASPDLPDWQINWRHITTDGKAALTQPSPANSTLAFPPPVEAPLRSQLAAAGAHGAGIRTPTCAQSSRSRANATGAPPV